MRSLVTSLIRLGVFAGLASHIDNAHGLPHKDNSLDDFYRREVVNTTGQTSQDGPKPFYAIAHRVLDSNGVKDALNNGANALEIDMTAWTESGWWADHDGLPTSAGDTAEVIFNTIASYRQSGSNVIFVWLDIKNPDYCTAPEYYGCSIEKLRDLARGILEPAGVKVLYGFYSADGSAYRNIRDNLNSNEAININEEANVVEQEYLQNGPSDLLKRTYAYGYYDLGFQFGNCQESSYYTCTELRQASESGVFGHDFGWTVTKNQQDLVDSLMGTANVDGLIYGFMMTYYYDHDDVRNALGSITSWIANHPEKRYLATVEDQPW